MQAQTAALDVVREATGVPETDVDMAEGYRWVTRLTRLILDWIVERSDPLHPQLFDLQDEYKKLLVDNPDVHYTFCVLDDSRTYRLVGFRGECAYLGMTFGTAFGQGPVGGRTGTQTQTHIDEFELGPTARSTSSSPPRRRCRTRGRATRSCSSPARPSWPSVRPTSRSRPRSSPGSASSWCPSRARSCRHPILSSEELAPKLEFAAMFLTFIGGTAMQMWNDAGTEHEHVRRARPARRTWRRRRTRCARTPTPR